MKISIIIPALNEAENLRILLPYLSENLTNDQGEIVVVDGGSTDDTVQVTEGLGVRCLSSEERGRARQMNVGAYHTDGDMLYFVHADTRPPTSFVSDINEAVRSGFPMGNYRFRFDSPSPLLRINSYFTRFDRMMFRGGDQTLFVTRELFEEFGGFDESFIIMEEYDFLKRVRKKYPFRIMPKDVLVSARKYESNSYLKVNFANLVVFTMYRLGYPQQRIISTYYRMLRQENYKFEA